MDATEGRGILMSPEDRREKIAKLEAELRSLKDEYFCSFCAKSSHDLFCLIAGPTVFICDECVATCNDIIEERRRALNAAGGPAKWR